ncbi:hypothetical protein C5B73_25395 [Nocardia cyriacigeorgica]|nr:hypothetical protein C5B73_25395 [Nocardia cyriacigeorgica]
MRRSATRWVPSLFDIPRTGFWHADMSPAAMLGRTTDKFSRARVEARQMTFGHPPQPFGELP